MYLENILNRCYIDTTLSQRCHKCYRINGSCKTQNVYPKSRFRVHISKTCTRKANFGYTFWLYRFYSVSMLDIRIVYFHKQIHKIFVDVIVFSANLYFLSIPVSTILSRYLVAVLRCAIMSFSMNPILV